LSSRFLYKNLKIKIYKTIILPVLYGCVRVFENRVLRRKFEPKREEVAGGWRRLHNEELYDITCILHQILLG
jgi:hypothetical protein